MQPFVAAWNTPDSSSSRRANAMRATCGAYEGETRWSVNKGTVLPLRSVFRIHVTLFSFPRRRFHPKFAHVRITSASGAVARTFLSPASFVRPYTLMGLVGLASSEGLDRPSKT